MKMKKAEAQVKAREQVRGAALVEIQMISGEQQVKKEKKGEKKRKYYSDTQSSNSKCDAQKVVVDLNPKLQFCLRTMT